MIVKYVVFGHKHPPMLFLTAKNTQELHEVALIQLAQPEVHG